MKGKRFLPLVLFAVLFLIITYLADTGLIPTKIKLIPYYDSIGHFVLFGIYAFLAQMAFRGKKYHLIPIGSTLITFYAVADEFMQKFSPNRSFDLWDLFFGLAGIITTTLLFKVIKHEIN